MNKLEVASFFTGIGGFDIAFERLGMDVVFQCEINTYCQNVLRYHWPHIELSTDVEAVNTEQIPTNDFWCAGFPCQDLSLANQGKRLGLDGNRSGLFHRIADLIETRPLELRPRWVLFENVPGLLNSHGGNDFRIVLQRLTQLGYDIAWRVLDAKYFGTPQRRRRVFILCSLGNSKSINALFEPDLMITDKQGMGIKDILDVHIPEDVRNYFVVQHASIGRKPTAGPQAKGYRNDGETYTFDSRGSADVIARTTTPFQLEIANSQRLDLTISNRYRTVGNAVNVNVVQSIGEKISRLDEQEFDEELFNQIFNEFTNAAIPLRLENIDNISRWMNAGILTNGECLMINTLEHFNIPVIEHLNIFVQNGAPLDHFLSSSQLQSILDRADYRIEKNPNSERLPEDFRSVIIRQRDTLLKNREIDKLLVDKKRLKELRQNDIYIPKEVLDNLFVRRMTALEYEQMQGFPHNWTTWETELMYGNSNQWLAI